MASSGRRAPAPSATVDTATDNDKAHARPRPIRMTTSGAVESGAPASPVGAARSVALLNALRCTDTERGTP